MPCPGPVAGLAAGRFRRAEEGADFLCAADDAPRVAGQRTLAGDEMPGGGGTSRQPALRLLFSSCLGSRETHL